MNLTFYATAPCGNSLKKKGTLMIKSFALKCKFAQIYFMHAIIKHFAVMNVTSVNILFVRYN